MLLRETIFDTLSQVGLVTDNHVDIPIDRLVLNNTETAQHCHYRLSKPNK